MYATMRRRRKIKDLSPASCPTGGPLFSPPAKSNISISLTRTRKIRSSVTDGSTTIRFKRTLFNRRPRFCRLERRQQCREQHVNNPDRPHRRPFNAFAPNNYRFGNIVTIARRIYRHFFFFLKGGGYMS